jgi:YidC/Oxa1 family membrane protein insertase
MEKRILIAFTLSFLVFFMYSRMYRPQPGDVPVTYPEKPGTPETYDRGPEQGDIRGETRDEATSASKEQAEAAPSVSETPLTEEKIEAEREQQLEIDTPLYVAVLSNRGGNLRSFTLKNYEDGEGNPYEMIPQEASRMLAIHPLDVIVEGEGSDAIKNALFETSVLDLRLSANEQKSLEMNWADGRGLKVTKKLVFSGDSYVMGVEVSVRRSGAETRKTVFFGPGAGEKTRSGTYAQPDKGVVRSGQEIEFFDAGDIEDGDGAAIGIDVVGVSSHYFAGLMLPSESREYESRFNKQSLEIKDENGDGKKRDFISAALVARGIPARFNLFLGPKEHDRLAALGPGIEKVIDYGSWMRFLAVPLRTALVWINDFVGNYGWSIVLLTILINVALIPLKHHSYVSMRKMQKLSPQIKKIQEKYKKLKPTDPKQQEKNQEVMALYKKHGASPMSGCLPMLLMLPFFFAFYRLLMVSIELRHAPFMLWIQDLSTYDPYFVLPILMGVTQIGIQKMSPQTSADPMQQKIMMLMPVMFIFILAWAPAGLVLYWFVNNLVSIGQQTFTNRLMKEKEAAEEKKAAGEKKSRKKKSSARS